MSTCSRTALRLSRSLPKTILSSRTFASLGSCGDWFFKASFDAKISTFTWNTGGSSSASTKNGSKESSAEKTDIILESFLSRSFPLPHVNHGSTINSNMANLSSFTITPLSIFDPVEYNEAIQAMNRNARRPKKANKGARPCSRVARRKKKDAIGKRRR